MRLSLVAGKWVIPSRMLAIREQAIRWTLTLLATADAKSGGTVVPSRPAAMAHPSKMASPQ